MGRRCLTLVRRLSSSWASPRVRSGFLHDCRRRHTRCTADPHPTPRARGGRELVLFLFHRRDHLALHGLPPQLRRLHGPRASARNRAVVGARAPLAAGCRSGASLQHPHCDAPARPTRAPPPLPCRPHAANARSFHRLLSESGSLTRTAGACRRTPLSPATLKRGSRLSNAPSWDDTI